MGGKSSGGDTSTTIRYAGYIEDAHRVLIQLTEEWRNTCIPLSPFAGYEFVDIENSFTFIYNMFGEFMSDVDVENLFDRIFLKSTTGPLIDNLVAAQAVNLQDDIEVNSLPRYETGMRDINAVQSSSFVVGRALITAAKTRELSRFDAELRYKMIPVADERWKAELSWNEKVVNMEAQLYKFFISAKMDMDDHNYAMRTKNTLWPFTVLEYNRLNLAAMTGATNSKTDVAGTSTTGKVIGGAMTGAVGGAMVGAQYASVGGGWGAAIGAVVGGVAGALSN